MKGKKKCSKAQMFPSEELALQACRTIPGRPNGTMPFRAYYCKDHKKWHISSRLSFKRKE